MSIQTDHTLLDRFVTHGAELTAQDWNLAAADYGTRGRLAEEADALTARAYGDGDPDAQNRVQDLLGAIYEQDFSIPPAERLDHDSQPILRDVAARLENAFLTHEAALVPESALTGYPHTAKEYVRWLEDLVNAHVASRHEFYTSFVEAEATKEDIRFFMVQEGTLDPRFDDILALVQVGTTGVEKMEIAKNYWDEMGNGEHAGVHTTIFAKSHTALGIDSGFIADNTLLEAKVCGNLSSALALSRRHYYKAAGYFGATEYLVPRRFEYLTRAWKELGLPPEGVEYHLLHMEIDVEHGESWFNEVIGPVVERDPRLGREIALGAVLRLNTSARYLDAIVDHCRASRGACG
ncbi:iron-containing redox enzyme family protein [Nocardiopsis sp. EMB25]|uniref:iron-containing redox enzyme family protein n=1 Tax=Nocardiopsis sp. EMB25 TaxID=2835867 RepID=UPI002284225D|nr:iron-containing redox enzyme family protein [Nocardiopsis sp. EMB25]MCY9786124.1 iron-containing redox enzyme family protein [Nocardiopsis sp. EMB25]